MKHVSHLIDLLSSAHVSGASIAEFLGSFGVGSITVTPVSQDGLSTDFIAIEIPGSNPAAPRLGIVGRLGGVGARPSVTGLVSDSDGAVVALAAAAQLMEMHNRGDVLEGSVIIHTHICPAAGTRPQHPVPMMKSPFAMREMMRHEVSQRMDAILAVDTTRGNRLVNQRGVALTPVAKQGYLLPIPDLMLDLMGWVSGQLPLTLPLTTQDITPYENGLPHVNSIMQPTIATDAPVVGVALTAQTTVPGCATGVTNAWDTDVAMRFCVEVAKMFGAGKLPFVHADHWAQLQARYGSLAHLQTVGNVPASA